MTAGQIQIQRRGDIPLAVIRRTVRRSELSRVVPECCGLVWQAVRAQQTRAGRHVALYWDDAIRLEVGVELLGPFVEQGEVVCSAAPGGVIASTVHFGPYSQLGAAHEAIRQWCEAQNHKFAGPSWEIYGHWQDEWDRNPSLIRTDVHYLLRDS